MHNYHELYDYLCTLPIVCTHSHELQPEIQQGFGLHDVLMNSYVQWCNLPLDETPENIARFTKQLKHNAHFYWMEKSLQHLCGIDKPLNEETYWEFDKAIREHHQDREYPDKVIRNICKYNYVILDQPGFPGIDNGYPDLNKPVFRIDMLLMGHNPALRDHDDRNAMVHYNLDPNMSFDEYVAFCENKIRSALDGGCIGLKCVKAYDRTNYFVPSTYEEAKVAYMNPDATAEDIYKFENYIFFKAMDIANEYHVPVQWHTGLGKMIDSGAKYIRNVIEMYPDITFCVFHGSYPWMDDLCGLVHNYPNVRADICWLPIISTEACVRFIKEIVQVGRLETMMWGSDTFVSEESYGSLMAARKAIARAFAELIADGYMDMEDAKRFCRHIMYKNAADTFGLDME